MLNTPAKLSLLSFSNVGVNDITLRIGVSCLARDLNHDRELSSVKQLSLTSHDGHLMSFHVAEGSSLYLSQIDCDMP
jgi:hypothetical protein